MPSLVRSLFAALVCFSVGAAAWNFNSAVQAPQGFLYSHPMVMVCSPPRWQLWVQRKTPKSIRRPTIMTSCSWWWTKR